MLINRNDFAYDGGKIGDPALSAGGG